MHIRSFPGAILATTLVLATASCASGSATNATNAATASASPQASEFPIGRFQNGELIAVMNADGSYVGTTGTGEDWVRGTYVVTGDVVAITDSWMIDKYKENSCVGKGTGRYHWTTTATGMRYTLIEDPCEARARGLGDNGAWTRLP